MSLADSSMCLAPPRRTSLVSKPRPMTSCGVPQEYSSLPTRRHSGMDWLLSTQHYLRREESAQAEVVDDKDDAGEGMAMAVQAITSPRPRRSHSIGQSIRQGVSELKSLGRRLSTSVRPKSMYTKQGGQTQNHPPSSFAYRNTLPSADERPRSRGWFSSYSSRRRPSLPLLQYELDQNPPEYSVVGPVPGSRRRPPILPDNRWSGAGARASAAAQNEAFQQIEAFHTQRSPPLPHSVTLSSYMADPKIDHDSESGIGIETALQSRRASETPDVTVMRLDPAEVFATELTAHILSFLDPVSILGASAVSRKWRSVALGPSLWRHLFLCEYGPQPPRSGSAATSASDTGRGGQDRDWRKMFKIRHLIDKRWQNGEAAAIYLNGHKDSVYCVQFDGSKIITGSRDHTVRVWDTRTYQCVRKLGPPNVVRERHHARRGVEVEPHGALPFCTIEYSSPDPVSAQALTEWHEQSILCLQYDEEIMVTGSSDFSCIVWSIEDDYQPMFRLRGHTAGVLDVCIDPQKIITCSKDTTIKIWDRYSGQLIRTLRGHTGPVNAVQLRENLLASASGDGMSRLWRLDDGVCIKEFSSYNRGLACVEFSEDGRTIFAGGNDKVVYEYDTTTGRTVREFKGHSDLVRSLHLDSRNGRIISGSYDASVKVWDCLDQQQPLRISFEGWTTSWILSAKSDYRKIVCTSQDGRVVVIDFGYGIEGIEILEA